VRIAYHPPEPAVSSLEAFDGLVRSIFTHRRKMLSNALAPWATIHAAEPAAALEAAGIDGRRRPETLDLAELCRLAEVFVSP
jgi:16S rRNA A1518/A1519 N6-dimethyltransferase RsmA/KsgA/DIM1 with predicted DNA glycosylase/AP lyase activity